ncbi:uncharacterized protein FN964_014878, partial [Alca torda]
MWAFLAQLLIALALLAFFLVSCQNVMHIVRGSVRFLLKHAHRELDKELGESQGLADDEEALSTRVVRRRVLVKVLSRELRDQPGADAEESSKGTGQGRRQRLWGACQAYCSACRGAPLTPLKCPAVPPVT